MVKEDVGIYTSSFGIYLLFKKKWKLGMYTICLSLTWFFIALTTLYLLNHGPPPYFSRWISAPHSFKSIFNFFLDFIHRISLLPLLKLLAFLLFLPLLKPSYFILAIVPYLVNATSSLEAQHNLKLYYSAPIIPFLFGGVIHSFLKLKRQKHVDISLIAFFLLLLNIGNLQSFSINEHHLIGHTLLKQIPSDTAILAQVDIIPHLKRQKAIGIIGIHSDSLVHISGDKLQAEYIIFDTKGNKWPLSEKEFEKELRRYITHPSYFLWLQTDGDYIFKFR